MKPAKACSSSSVITLDNCDRIVEIKDLANLMIKDPVLLANWTQLSDSLGSQPQDKAKWERGINNLTLQYYDLFSEMLQSWLSLTSDDPGLLSGTFHSRKRTVQELCNILRENNNFNAIAETLEEKFGKLSTISTRFTSHQQVPQQVSNKITRTEGHKTLKWPITHGLNHPAKNFCGRIDELKTLTTNFYSSKGQKLVLVCGIGGIGKTELCRKFAKNVYNYNLFGIKFRRFYCTVSRVLLHGENVATLRDSILRLAGVLCVSTERDSSNSEIFEHLVSLILENCRRLLVIIDNVDVNYEEVKKVINIVHITKYAKRMFVVVTSRNTMILQAAGNTIKLDGLSQGQARMMLQSSVNFPITDSDANILCELLQYFPLALQQAIAYIKQQRNHFRTPDYSVSNYVQEFELKKAEMLDQKLNEFEHDYSMTTLVTWDMTVRKMSEDAVDILKIVAHLEPNGIEMDFLERASDKCYTFFDSGVDLLQKYALVKIENKVHKVLSTHRLIQEVMRVKVENKEEYYKSLCRNVLFACRKFKGFNEGGPLRSELIQLNSISRLAWNCEISYNIQFIHEVLLFLLEHDLIKCAVDYIQVKHPYIPFSLDDVEDGAIVKVILCGIFDHEKYYYDSITNKIILRSNTTPVDRKSLEQGFKISRKYFGHTDELTIGILNQLAVALWHEGEFDKALTLWEDLIRHPLNEAEKKLSLKTIENIVEEKYKTRISVLKRLFKLLTHFDGFKMDVTELKMKVIDFNIITGTEIESEFNEANYIKLPLEILEMILPHYKRVLGDPHPLSVRVKNAIANLLIHTDNRRCVKLSEQVLDSPVDEQYAEALFTLCIVKHKTDKNYEEQRKVLEKYLKTKRLKLGDSHSNTVRIKELLAYKLESLGQLELALKLFQEVRDSAINCEWNDQDIKKSRENVIRLRLKIGDFSNVKTSEDIYKEFDKVDDYTWRKFSFQQLEKILKFYKSILDETNEQTLRVQITMAWRLFEEKKNCKESMALIDQVIIQSKDDIELVRHAYKTIEWIGEGLFKNQEYDKSRELLEKVLKFRIQFQGENHEDSIQTEDTLNKVLSKLGLFESDT